MAENAEAVCPYWRKVNGLKMYCELATFRFPDAKSRREFMANCCDAKRCKECPLYKTLMAYYERMYSGEVTK